MLVYPSAIGLSNTHLRYRTRQLTAYHREIVTNEYASARSLSVVAA